MFPWSWKEGGVMRRRTKRSEVEKGELRGGEEEDWKEGCGGDWGVTSWSGCSAPPTVTQCGHLSSHTDTQTGKGVQ